MGKYKFSIKDYHAIKNAEITLDGITVIAGINGCGKSTISRWLDAIVNCSNNYEKTVANEFISNLNRELKFMKRLLQNIDIVDPQIQLIEIISSNTEDQSTDLEGFLNEFKTYLYNFCNIVRNYIAEAPEDEINWIKSFLAMDDSLFGSFIDEYYDTRMANAHKQMKEAEIKMNDRLLKRLMKFIIREGDEQLKDIPKDISLEENGLELIKKDFFRKPLGLIRSIYYDSPIALTVRSTDKSSWSRLQDQISHALQPAPPNALKLMKRIQRIIGGNIIQNSEDLKKYKELRYVRQNDELDIPVSDAATGIKSFAIILRILENGYLDENSLLIIDEPEVHLHPQWIVEFARILVMIYKYLGTKVLIASHNPDMIAAIQSISKAEATDANTNFYQAVENEEDQRFNYKWLGNDVEDIFKSFNIALSRIQLYGE